MSATHLPGIAPGVSAAHPVTARTGADILRAGGSAVDAGVAMMLVSCSAESIFTGLGGGGFATTFEADTATVRVVDFFVAVPGLGGRTPGPGVPIDVSFVGQPVPYDIGAATVAVPGIPAGALHLWERWGSLPWADVVTPAIVASRGTPLPRAHARLLPSVSPAMVVGEGARVFRRPDGNLLRTGDRLVHPDHEHAFHTLATDPRSFYSGRYAETLVAAVADGGALDETDLRAYTVVESEPRHVRLDGPGPSASVLARGDDLDDVLATLATAARTVSADPLTDPASALALVEALRCPDRRAETTNLVAVDAQGNACVITTSLGLGAGVWVPGYGVHLNSMLGEGELIREQLAPGQRMGSMMSPLVATDDEGALVLAGGAAGGSRIRPALVQAVLRTLAGAHPRAAIDAPRLVAGADTVRLEPGFSAAVVRALIEAGHDVRVAEGRDAYFGGVSIIGRHGCGADPRRSGAVVSTADPFPSSQGMP
ncbi:MAG: gamma-glutamyltransferase [Propionibacteriaceae bacterium]